MCNHEKTEEDNDTLFHLSVITISHEIRKLQVHFRHLGFEDILRHVADELDVPIDFPGVE